MAGWRAVVVMGISKAVSAWRDRLGLGFSTKVEPGHGQGFRIILKLAAEIGAVVRSPKSIPSVGTEIRISFIKVGAAQLHHDKGKP